MPYSKIEVCNAALQLIGQENIISSFSDGSPEADLFNLQYDMALGDMLRSCPWRFARREAELPIASGIERVEWSYCYSAPGDMLKPLRVFVPGTKWNDEAQPFETQSYPYGILILSNLDDAYLEYTARVEDPSLWDASFLQAFTLRLASSVCLALTGSDSKAEAILRRSQMAWQNAVAMTASDARDLSVTRKRYTRSRR